MSARVALPRAARGIPVTGIELSSAMVERLRSKPGGGELPVTINDMATTVGPGRCRRVPHDSAKVDTERIWQRAAVSTFAPDVQRSALRKLLILDAAETLPDLRVPPGNRLEKLKGDRSGQHGIRVNDQWRICFRWTTAGPEDVEITDYH